MSSKGIFPRDFLFPLLNEKLQAFRTALRCGEMRLWDCQHLAPLFVEGVDGGALQAKAWQEAAWQSGIVLKGLQMEIAHFLQRPPPYK